MADQRQPDILGAACDFGTIEINVDGTPCKGVSAIDWEHGLEPGKVRVNGDIRTSERTTGIYDSSGSMEMPLKWGARLVSRLGGAGSTGVDYMAKEFSITVNWRPKGDPTMYTCKMDRVRIKKEKVTNKQGNEATMMSFELDIISCSPVRAAVS